MSKTRRNLAANHTHNGNGHSHLNGTNRLEALLKPKVIETAGPDLSIKKQVEARTPNQKAYLRSIRNNDITFCIGPAGSGKTHVSMGYAAQALSSGIAQRIILVRPAVSCGEDLGFLPGDLTAKLNSYLRPAYDELLEFFTIQQLNNLISGKFPIIEGAALGQIKGRSFKNSIVILDESQDANYRQIKNFLTRMGENTKMIVTGDIGQSDTFNTEGGEMTALEEVMIKMEGAESVGYIRMTPADIQRHPRIEQILSRL